MRNRIANLDIPDHVGLAYDVWAPTGPDGKIPTDGDRKKNWLQKIAAIPVPADYKPAFDRWKASFTPADVLGDFTLTSRLLLGHGNPAPSEVGLTVHHTWGVPLIPGSALKGLCANYVQTAYGPQDNTSLLWELNDTARRDWRGVIWKGARIRQGPGEFYRDLFGAPDAEADQEFEKHGLRAGAQKGQVIFHDALYIPDSAPGDKPFAVDVLTPHQSEYYRAAGDQADQWPNDYDDPNPVNFLNVRPGAKFLIALSGPEDWVALARHFLTEALEDWGVGGKTAAGYGRGRVAKWRNGELSAHARSDDLDEFARWVGAPQAEDGTQLQTTNEKLGGVENQWIGRLSRLSDAERMEAVKLIEKWEPKKSKKKKLQEQAARFRKIISTIRNPEN